MFASGRRIRNQHLAQAGEVRGMLAIREEYDSERRRHVRVARIVGGQDKQVPPLFDVQITASVSGKWSLLGFERVEAGPMSDEHLFGQAWLVEPAPETDLINAEAEITRMARLLVQHGVDPNVGP